MSMDISAVEYTPFEDRLHTCFGDMLVYKSSQNTKFFADQSMPSFIRDWLMMRFSDAEGRIQNEKIAQYVKKTIPSKEQWSGIMLDMLHGNRDVRFLTKVKIEFDTNRLTRAKPWQTGTCSKKTATNCSPRRNHGE